MAKVDPQDFIINTDYEMDKIIYYTEGSMMPSGTVGTPSVKYIDHNLGFTPLIFGVWSFNSDFTDSKMSPYNQFTDTGVLWFQYSSGNSQILLQYRNDDEPTQKLYYRLYAFEPSNVNKVVPKTSGKAREFIVNTDYNYCKLFKKGYVDGSATITHNLGYIPLVLAWTGSTQVWSNDQDDYVEVTKTQVIIKRSANWRTHYRIYYDEV